MWSGSGHDGVIHGYECCGGAFWVFLNRLSTDGGSMS